MTLSVGDRVRHPSMPGWGVGQVVDLRGDGKLVVYFEHAGEKLLKGVPLEQVNGIDVTRPFVVRHPRTKSTHRRPTRSIQQYIAAFLDEFPQGFYEPLYISRERDYKVEARRLLQSELSRDAVQALLAAGDHERMCTLAGKIVNATNVIFPNEKMSLRDGLRDPRLSARFAMALGDLLYGRGPYEVRFTALVDVLTEAGGAKWTIATYFPFLSTPTEHMFLKPVSTQRIAEACGVELNYRPEPNWLTYQSLIRLTDHLTKVLADLKPRDMIDLQGFIWLVART